MCTVAGCGARARFGAWALLALLGAQLPAIIRRYSQQPLLKLGVAVLASCCVEHYVTVDLSPSAATFEHETLSCALFDRLLRDNDIDVRPYLDPAADIAFIKV